MADLIALCISDENLSARKVPIMTKMHRALDCHFYD